MRANLKISILISVVLLNLFFTGCNFEEITLEHEIVFEENAYLRGPTSGEGYINLMDYPEWRAWKNSIIEVTGILIQYRVTRNLSPSDLTAKFFFGENKADIYLGETFLPQGITHNELQTLPVFTPSDQWINMILQKNGFWYSVQGNNSNADVDFEPVRVTIYGTFEVAD